MTSKPVTRFAPSPTGYLHIGGARTALFNWLYAKAKGGTFLLRIEDTDRARSTPDAIRAIIDGLAWVGIDWSGEPLFQFARADRHRQVANQLLAQGRAYHCYLTPEELEAMRAKAEAEKRPPRIDSPWRERDSAEGPKGVKPALRLKAPREGETIIEDRVQGRVAFPNKDLEDLVILRSDGTPTYNLAVVVDDHDMGVTHVIRGVEHLSNTPKQSQIYDAMGWARPAFAHVPLIHDAAGKKLSKRHGAAGVEEYRAMGYLPAALRNYLVRLGWSHGDDEIFSTQDLVRWFDIDGIGQSPARFDFAKLDNLNGHYIRQTPDAELLANIRAAYADMAAANPGLPHIDTEAGWQKLAAALPGLKERAKTLVEIVSGAAYLYGKRPLVLDESARKQLTPPVVGQLRELAARLTVLNDWSASALEAAVRAFAEATGLKLGKIAQPLRAALTGSTVSPPIFDVMAVLGREETLARLSDQTKA